MSKAWRWVVAFVQFLVEDYKEAQSLPQVFFLGQEYRPWGACNTSSLYLALESLQHSIRNHKSISLEKDCYRCLGPQANPQNFVWPKICLKYSGGSTSEPNCYV